MILFDQHLIIKLDHAIAISGLWYFHSLTRASFQQSWKYKCPIFYWNSSFVLSGEERINKVDPIKEILSNHKTHTTLSRGRFCVFNNLWKHASHVPKNTKPATLVAGSFCGEEGIRTPGGVTLAGFQDQCIRPLCHFSLFNKKVTHFCGCKYRVFI